MPKRLVHLLYIIITLFLGCSGSSGSGDNQPVDENTPVTISRSDAPLCKKPFNVPSNFGESCGAGSNMNLCKMDQTVQSDGSFCLFDNTKDQPKAYITVNCNPSAMNTCPSNYTCKKEDCSKSFVCVADTANRNIDLYKNLFLSTETLPSPVSDFTTVKSSYNSKGDLLYINSGSEILLRIASTGKWIALHISTPELAAFYPKNITVIDNDFYIFNSTNGYHAPQQFDSRTMYKVSGENVSLVQTPSSNPNQVCLGQKVSGCYGEVNQIWKDKDGALSVLVTQGQNQHLLYKMKNGNWVKQNIDPKIAEMISQSEQMRDGHFVFSDRFQKIFVSTDLSNWLELAPPSKLAAGSYFNLFAFSKNDIWLIDNQSNTYHWNGTSWLTEKEIYNAKSVIKNGPGKYLIAGLASQDFMIIYSRQGGCWTEWKVPQDRIKFILTNGNITGFLSGSTFEIINTDFIPER